MKAWLSRFFFGDRSDRLRDLHNELDLLLETRCAVDRDITAVRREIHALENQQ